MFENQIPFIVQVLQIPQCFCWSDHGFDRQKIA
jgi:hypothetical protein